METLENLLHELEQNEPSVLPMLEAPPEVTLKAPVMVAEQTVIPARPGDIDLNSKLIEHEAIADKLLRQIDEDRAQVAKVVDLCLDRLSDPNAKAAYIEQLVAALKTQVDTSNNAVKVLDSRTKLLQIIKGNAGVNIQNNNITGSSELEKILARPTAPDEDI